MEAIKHYVEEDLEKDVGGNFEDIKKDVENDLSKV